MDIKQKVVLWAGMKAYRLWAIAILLVICLCGFAILVVFSETDYEQETRRYEQKWVDILNAVTLNEADKLKQYDELR